MNGFDFESLAALAQLGLGLAGFSGIGLLLTRSTGRMQKFEVYRLGIMLGTAVGAMVLALVPITIAQFGAGVEATCRLSALCMALLSASLSVYYRMAIRHFRRTVPEIVGPIASRLVFGMHVANALVQTLSAAGVLAHCVGWYWIGLLWLLLAGTYQFVRILFVRPREDAEA